jgi:hypothetical protein
MEVDLSLRSRLVEDLLAVLRAAVSGSESLLRGSLAEDRADPFSDIDVLWEVPDQEFTAAIAELPAILAQVRPVASLRSDPDFQRSAKRRLVFIRFAGVPLFWRVDLDVFARSTGRDPDYDRDNPTARGTDWSVTESALMNAIAAVKSHLRGRDDEAAGLLAHAERRIGIGTSSPDLRERMLGLIDAIIAQDSTTAALGADIKRLVSKAL